MRILEIKPTTLHIIFAILFIIPFQAVLFFPLTFETLEQFREPPADIIQTDLILLIGFILLPIIYSIYISLILTPKRIVNPLYIQIGAFFIFSWAVINNALTESAMITSQTFANLFIGLFFVAMYIGLIGFIQYIFVWWVIGLNYESSNQCSYLINCPPKKVMKILGKEFKRIQRFGREKVLNERTDNPIVTLKCEDNNRNSVIIGFGSYNDDENKCILATVTYHKRFSCIKKSLRANAMCESIIAYIEKKLRKENVKFSVDKLDKVDDLVSISTFSLIENIIKSKFEILTYFYRKLSNFFRIAIFLTISFMILTFGAYYFRIITVDRIK